MRWLLALQPFSDRVEDRLTGRIEYSLRLFEGAAAAGRVLDVGSAIGWLERAIVRPGVSIVGLEHDGEQIAKARSNVPDGTFIHGSVLAIPFACASFDMVTMFEVLEHIPRQTEPAALREIRRVLRPGGAFLMSTPNRNPVACALDPAWYMGHRHYSANGLCAMLKSAGFGIEQLAIRGGLWELLGMNLHYLFKHLLSAEVPARGFWERRRRSEYLRENGISTIFVVARAA